MANVWALLSGVFGLVASGEQIKKGLGLVGEKTTAGVKAEKVQVKSRVHRVKNIDERVGYIVKLIRAGKIDPRVKELAAKILTHKDKKGRWVVPEKDWQAEVSAIFYAVRRRIRYTHDAYGVDQFAAAKRSLQWHIGDCDDACVVLGSLLQAVGYPVRLRVVQTKDSDDWDHIYLLVRIPPMGQGGRWHPLDASVDKQAGWEVPRDRLARIRDYEVPV